MTATIVTWAVIGVVLGLVAGSFLATLVIRWPAGRGVVWGRSRCDLFGCGLSILALVPLAGFVALGGRCGACHGPIDRRHPLIELACAAIGGAALAIHPGTEGIAGALFGWTLLALAVLDIEHLWLPDALTLPLILLGLGAGGIGLPPSLAERAIGGVAGFVALEIVRRTYRQVRHRDGMGKGDPKLFAAIGAWLGWKALPLTLMGAAGVGLAWWLVMAATRSAKRDVQVPFGAMLGLTAWVLWAVPA